MQNVKYFLILLFFFISLSINSEIFKFNYKNGDKYQLVIRSDFKIYLNNKYQGYLSKEVKGILDVTENGDNNFKINGEFYRLEKAMRDTLPVGLKIDRMENADFILNKNGNFVSSVNSSFPPLQGIPFFPEKNLKIGDVYEGTGKTGINLNEGDSTQLIKIPIIIKYSGKSEMLGNSYDYFEINYGYGNIETKGNIIKARGIHTLKLYYDGLKGNPVFMKDNFKEEFELENGNKIGRDGFYLYFYKNISIMDKNKIITDLTSDADKNILEDLTFKQKKEGVSITLNNLKFKANSIELLDSEKDKIESIYKMLSKIQDRSFMIIGHTAKSGTEEEQIKLSLEIAKTISQELVKRGIKQERILFIGKGSQEPIAPNDSEENMQKNRRVEIIILED